MSTSLADLPDTFSPIHLFLCGPSKVGKTDWVADAILDGFVVFYIDADNGLNTLKKRLRGNTVALSRVHFIQTIHPLDFLMAFFGKNVFRWNKDLDLESGSSDRPEHEILEVKRNRIPEGVIVVVDSWTSTMFDLLHDSAKRNGVAFETFNEGGQAAYGDASRRANLLGGHIQHAPFHMIIQGHPEYYERLEKPRGKMVTKAKEMIVKENILVAQSCSKPHGFSMAKFFNEWGWMGVDVMGNFTLDFKQQNDRIGGGSPMKIGNPKKGFRWSELFATPSTEVSLDWIRSTTGAEIIEARNAAAAASNAAKAAAKKPVESKPVVAANPGTTVAPVKTAVAPVRSFSLSKK